MIKMANYYFPDEITLPVLLGDVDDNSVDKVLGYRRNLRQHIEMHYGLFASQSPPRKQMGTALVPSDLTSLDLIYHHVYGDYRLSMSAGAADNAPAFLKTSVPVTMLRYRTAPLQHIQRAADATTVNPVGNYLAAENPDELHGFLSTDGLEPRSNEWFQRELATEPSGMKFHLPSLGTMAVAQYSRRNIKDNLQKALSDMLYRLATHIEELDPRPQGWNDVNAGQVGLAAADMNNTHPLPLKVLKAVLEDPEYQEIRATGGAYVPSPAQINQAIQRCYRKDTVEYATKQLANELINLTGFKFGPGTPINFSRSATTNFLDTHVARSMPAELDTGSAVDNRRIIKEGEWIVVEAGIGPDPTNPAKQVPLYVIAMPFGYEDTWVVTNVPAKFLQTRAASAVDEEMIEFAQKKKKGLINPYSIVFQRIALDVAFCFEALFYASGVKTSYAYLHKSLNLTDKTGSVVKSYTNMIDPLAPNTRDEHKKLPAEKQKVGFVDSMAELRTHHTIAYLAGLRKSTHDKDAFDRFYKADLRLSEVKWLATALSDGGRVLYEKKVTPNLLAQLQYKTNLDPNEDNILPTADLKGQTIFYEIDSPILKDVIMQYDNEFVAFTVLNAFKNDNLEEKNLSKAVWGSVVNRSSEIVNRSGIKPHLLFAVLFDRVNALSTQVYTVKDNYPPQWAGTNTVTKLRTDPLVLGEDVEMKFYTDSMDEYINHLKVVYQNTTQIPIAILTSLTQVVIDSESDLTTLRESFVARIKSQASKNKLKGTNIVFDPYRTVISIMRSEIDIPLRFREEYVARKLDEDMKRRLERSFTSDGEALVLPADHPEHREKKMEYDSESALGKDNNPKGLPMPDYYPIVDATLNRGNPAVERALNDMILPGQPNFGAALVIPNVGALNPAHITQLKGFMTDPDTVWKVLPIEWRNEEIWDGRDSPQQPPHVSVVAHHRDTLGIRFELENPAYGSPFELAIAPYPGNNLTDYSSIFFKKYLKDKYDEANYVYIPPGKVFSNPGVTVRVDETAPAEGGVLPALEEVSYKTVDNRMPLDTSSTIMLPMEATDIIHWLDTMGATEEHREEVEVPEPMEVLSTAVDENTRAAQAQATAAKEQATATDDLTSATLEASDNFLAAGVKFDDAATKFETAGEHFRSAGESFERASQEYANLTKEMQNLVKATLESQREQHKLAAEADEKEDVSMKTLVGALKGLVNSGAPWITDQATAVKQLTKIIDKEAEYQWQPAKLRRPIVESGRDDFGGLESKKTKGSAIIRYAMQALVPALMNADEVMTSESEDPKTRWRKFNLGILKDIADDETAVALGKLGVSEKLAPVPATD